MPVNAILLAAFGALQIADVVTTQQTLSNGGWEGAAGIAPEPPRGLGHAHLGNNWWIPKLALMAVCAAVMIRWKARHVAPLVALMGLVIANSTLWAYS
jgi:hypothetical protein